MKNKMKPELLYYIKGLVFNKSWTWKKKEKEKKTNTRKCDPQSGKRINGNWLGLMLDLTKTSHCYKYVQIIKGRAHNTQQIENLRRETEKKSQIEILDLKSTVIEVKNSLDR